MSGGAPDPVNDRKATFAFAEQTFIGIDPSPNLASKMFEKDFRTFRKYGHCKKTLRACLSGTGKRAGRQALRDDFQWTAIAN